MRRLQQDWRLRCRSRGCPRSTGPPPGGVIYKNRAPVSDTLLELKLPRPQEADLPNGLHVMVLQDRRAPQVSIQLSMRGAGGYYDPADQIGLAQFTAANVREGTATKTSTAIAEQLDRLSATLNVTTGMSTEDATIAASALTEHVDVVLDLMADVLMNPTFPEQEFARYKTQTRAQLQQQRAQAGFLAAERFSIVLAGDHPDGRVAPSMAVLDKTTRDHLVAFHRARYVPDHAVMAIAGDISMADAMAKLQSRFAAWKKTGTPAPKVADPAALGKPGMFLVERPNSVQTNLLVGVQAIKRTDPDFFAFTVLNKVIGGGPSGRLFRHLREEKGYTYGAGSQIDAPRFRGTWVADTEVRTEVTEPALTDLLDELKQVRETPIPAQGVRRREAIADRVVCVDAGIAAGAAQQCRDAISLRLARRLLGSLSAAHHGDYRSRRAGDGEEVSRSVAAADRRRRQLRRGWARAAQARARRGLRCRGPAGYDVLNSGCDRCGVRQVRQVTGATGASGAVVCAGASSRARGRGCARMRAPSRRRRSRRRIRGAARHRARAGQAVSGTADHELHPGALVVGRDAAVATDRRSVLRGEGAPRDGAVSLQREAGDRRAVSADQPRRPSRLRRSIAAKDPAASSWRRRPRISSCRMPRGAADAASSRQRRRSHRPLRAQVDRRHVHGLVRAVARWGADRRRALRRGGGEAAHVVRRQPAARRWPLHSRRRRSACVGTRQRLRGARACRCAAIPAVELARPWTRSGDLSPSHARIAAAPVRRWQLAAGGR